MEFRPPFVRSVVYALVASPVWIALGYQLLVRYVHEGGFLLWLSQALLLPDLLVSLAVGPERRSALGIAVLLLEVIYVWLVLYGSWWAIKFARRGPTRA